MSHNQPTGKNHFIKVVNEFFENIIKFKHLDRIVTNQNCIHAEIEIRLHLGNACYHAVQNFFSSSLLSKNINIQKYNLAVVLVACET
jgi:hypothetical protein